MQIRSWQDSIAELQEQGVRLPKCPVEDLQRRGKEQPLWIHVGGGNLYRAFHAEIAQDLADKGLLDRGVVVAETFSPFTIKTIYHPFNNATLQVVLHANKPLETRILASTADALFANPSCQTDWKRMMDYVRDPRLQLISFTITEKGYSLYAPDGNFAKEVAADIEKGPASPTSTMGIVASWLYARYQASAYPLALLSTDNFSRNGFRFRQAVLTIAQAWEHNKLVEHDFIAYASDENQVSFPWSMIDRITPNPSDEVAAQLTTQGLTDADLFYDERGVAYAGFANTEAAHYLVVEDSFPNGRPAFDQAGVIMSDRQTAERADTMKVTACLNPLHTGLAVFGCLLGYTRIYEEMNDPDLLALVKGLGYQEALPVVVDPKVIDPKAFIDELIESRLPNPALPDAPQRIAQDTSQKVSIRYGQTIQAYVDATDKDPCDLVYIPLVLAAWLRYLLARDDEGAEFTPAADPLLDSLQAELKSLQLGADETTVKNAIQPLLGRRDIFGVDLVALGLDARIATYLTRMLAGPHAVRNTLHAVVSQI